MGNFGKYYVYAYYDPRNFKIFYIGKGCGNRKFSHLFEDSEDEKVKTINDIRKIGHKPIIRVLVKDLTEEQALLVEKTIIWMNYEYLSNKSTGSFGENFRPTNTLHEELKGFDFETGIYHVNVGEGEHRDWDDCSEFEFLCAGGDPKWRDPLKRLVKDDIVIAYLKGKGFVGVGRVTSEIQKAVDFTLTNGKKLVEIKNQLKQQNIFENYDNIDLAQYVVGVNWIEKRKKDEAYWERFRRTEVEHLYTSQQVVSSLHNQPFTLKFIENKFGLHLDKLIVK